MLKEIISMLGALLLRAAMYGLPCCLLVASLGGLVMYRRFGAVFYRIFTWSLAGMSIAVIGYTLLLFFMVFIARDGAYQGQGLGIALAGPVVLAPVVAVIGGVLKFILLYNSRRDGR